MVPKETVKTSSGHIIFTPFAISRAIQSIKSSGSAGPVGLPALFWKKQRLVLLSFVNNV